MTQKIWRCWYYYPRPEGVPQAWQCRVLAANMVEALDGIKHVMETRGQDIALVDDLHIYTGFYE